MKKKYIYIIFLLLLFINNVNAASNTASYKMGSGCPNITLWCRNVGQDGTTNNKMDVIYFYNFYSSWDKASKNKDSPVAKAEGQGFCIRPGATAWAVIPKASYSSSFANHKCSEIINPEKEGPKQAYYVAITRAYQQMVKKGYLVSTESSGNATSSARRYGGLVGTIAVRWIASYYGYLETIGGYDSKFVAFSYSRMNSSSYWNNTKYVKAARKIAADAIKVGDYIKNGDYTYQQLVNKGKIWKDEWISEVDSISDITEGKDKNGKAYQEVTLNVTISVKNASRRPSKVNWDKFTFTTKDNKSKIASVKLLSSTRNYGKFAIKIRKTNGSWNKYYNLAKVTANYADQRNVNAHLWFYDANTSGTFQRFLFVKNYNSNFEIERTITWKPEESMQCVCQYDDSDNFTGNYILREYENGVKVRTSIIPSGDPRLEDVGCPSDCGEDPPEDRQCERVVNPNGTVTYYGNQVNGTNRIVDQQTYKKECLHICETPDQNEDKLYYCADPNNDTDGRVCNGQEYIEECYCTPRKQKCETNPNDPDCAEYEEKCPTCYASSSIPNTCGDFDFDSEIRGTINDINKTKTGCNKSANNIKMCVLGKKDMSGESFEATNILNGNRYCKVYCEESYQFSVPTARRSTSGGYFTLNSEISGTRNCYVASANDPTIGIDTENFINEINNLNKELLEAWNVWNTTKTENSKTTFTTLSKYIETYVSNYQACFDWVSSPNADLKFDPKVKFKYDDYGYNNSEGTFEMVGQPTANSSITYCAGNIDNQYNCIGTVSNTPQLGANLQYYLCNESACNAHNITVKTAKWIKKTVTKSANFTPSQKFSTYHQYGTVKTGNVCLDASKEGYNNCLWTRLPDSALPVELRTGKGAFKFNISYSNIGQSNSNGTLGRLIGNSNSVLNAYSKDKISKCENPSGTYEQNSGYVCAYVNNCDQCDVSCSGDNCTIEENCDGECKTSCRTCIFDGMNSNYKYRTISLNNLFPNSCSTNTVDCRKEGYNWTTQKAQLTKYEIESSGTELYENPEYSYTVSSAQIIETRKFNKEVGSYENTTIPPEGKNAYNCKKVTYNGIDYSVNCVSEFLNENTGKYFTQLARNTSGFKLWTEQEYCINGNCLSRTDGIGPSWK